MRRLTDVSDATTEAIAWYSRSADDAATAFDVDPERGLTGAEAASRLSRDGPNEITAEKPPSVWAIALQQLRDPMNIMLVAVTVGELRDR